MRLEKSFSIRGIARFFNVNKRLIQFILFPERQKKNLEDRKNRGGWRQYYNKDNWAKVMKEHRKYKYLTLTGRDNSEFLVKQSNKIENHKQNTLKEKKMDVVRQEKSRKELKDWYVLSQLKWSNGDYGGLTSGELKKYPQLIEAMRANIKLKRLINSKQ